MDAIQSINLITTNPAVRGGRPCLAGTELRVIDVVMAGLFHQRTPAEIATDYDVSLAAVHAALAYYYENKVALDADIRQNLAQAQAYKDEQAGNDGSSLLPG